MGRWLPAGSLSGDEIVIVQAILARERPREHPGGFDTTIRGLLNHRGAREDARAPEVAERLHFINSDTGTYFHDPMRILRA